MSKIEINKLKEIARLFDSFLQKICTFNSKLFVIYLRKKGVTIGDDTFFFGRVYVDLTRPTLIEIGRHCVFTNDVHLLTHGFDWAILKRKYGETLCSSGKITIEDNVFVGTSAIILKGVHIGRDSIIGAGSVVTHDIPECSVAVGNPCRVIMTIEDYFQSRKKRYVDEAKSYAKELFLRTGQVPGLGNLGEELPIFSEFSGSQQVYRSLDEFLIASGIPEKKITR